MSGPAQGFFLLKGKLLGGGGVISGFVFGYSGLACCALV